MAKKITMNARVGTFLASYKSNGAKALEMVRDTFAHGVNNSNDFQPLTRLVYGLDPAHSATARTMVSKLSRGSIKKGESADGKVMLRVPKGKTLTLDNESSAALDSFVSDGKSIGSKDVKDFFKPAKKEDSAFDGAAWIKRTIKSLMETHNLSAAESMALIRKAEKEMESKLAEECAVEAPAKAA